MDTMQFAMGPANQGVPLSDSARAQWSKGLADGSTTKEAFDLAQKAADFYNWLNTQGDSAWVQSHDASGHPTFTAQNQSQFPGCVLVATAVPNNAVVSGQQSPTGVVWNGASYNVVGTTTAMFTYQSQPVWHVSALLGLAAAYPVAKLAGVAWSNLLVPVAGAIKRGVQSCIKRAPAVDSVTAAETAGDAAAEDAALTGEVVGDAVVDVATGGLALVGLVVLLALPFLFRRHPKTVQHNVKIYNLDTGTFGEIYVLVGTTSDASVSLGPAGSSALQLKNNVPVPISGGTQTPLPAQSLDNGGDPDANPVMVVHEADFSLVSLDSKGKLDYAFFFNAFPGFVVSAFFNLAPKSAAVTLQAQAVGWTPTPAQLPKVTQSPLMSVLTLPSLGASLTVTFDQKQPTETAKDAYAINSIVAVSWGGLESIPIVDTD